MRTRRGCRRAANALRVAFVSSRDGGWDGIFTISIRGGTAKRVSPKEYQTHSQPRWSPGGKHILYASGSRYKRALMVVPHKGGTAEELATKVHDFAWSPDTR